MIKHCIPIKSSQLHLEITGRTRVTFEYWDQLDTELLHTTGPQLAHIISVRTVLASLQPQYVYSQYIGCLGQIHTGCINPTSLSPWNFVRHGELPLEKRTAIISCSISGFIDKMSTNSETFYQNPEYIFLFFFIPAQTGWYSVYSLWRTKKIKTIFMLQASEPLLFLL